MNLELWLGFSAVALIATSVPGPAMLLVASHSIRFGVKKSVTTVLGNITGLAILSSVSVAGLSPIILYSELAFNIVKVAGAIYLIYLGIKLWRSGLMRVNTTFDQTQKSNRSLYAQGVLVAISNPKAIVFTTALFPQFIDPANSLAVQFSLLVGTFMSLSFFCLLGCSIFVRRALASTGSYLPNIACKLFGGIFIGTGGTLLTTTYSAA